MTVAVEADVFLIALVGAAIWALSMIALKRGLAEGGNILQGSLLVAGTDAVVAWLVLVGLPRPALSGITLGVVGIFAASGTVGTALARLASFGGIDRVGASVNSAGISARPLFATALALMLLGEAVSLLTVVGIVVLVAGLVVLALSRGGDIAGWRWWEIGFPLAAAVGFAVSDVIRRFGLTETPVTTLQAVAFHETAGLVALSAYALVRLETTAGLTRRSTGLFVLSGLLNVTSLLFYFAALARGSVAVVTSTVGTAPLFVTVFATVLLGDLERITLRAAVAAVLVVAGAALITLA